MCTAAPVPWENTGGVIALTLFWQALGLRLCLLELFCAAELCLWGARAQQEQLHCWALHRMRCRRRLQSGWGGIWAAADWCLQVLHGGRLMAIRHQVCEAANRALDVWTVCDFTSTQPDDELLSKERLPAPSCKRSAVFQLHLLLMMAISRFSTVLLC